MNFNEQKEFSDNLKTLNNITKQINEILLYLPKNDATTELYKKAFRTQGIKANQQFLDELIEYADELEQNKEGR